MGYLRRYWRHLLLLLAIGLFVYLVVSHRGELVQVKGIITGASPVYLVLALLVQMVFYTLQALMFYQIVSLWMPLSFRDVFAFTLASNSFNKLLPSGGISGLLVFISRAREHGLKPGLSLVVNGLFYLLDYLSFLVVVWLAFYIFNRTVGLGKAGITAVLIFSLVIVLCALIFGFLLRYPQQTGKWLEGLVRHLPWGRSYLTRQIRAWQDSENMIPTGGANIWRSLVMTFLVGLAMQFSDVFILYLCYASLGHKIAALKVITGFGLASVISLASMVPQGIGIYESSMTWVLNRLGTPFAVAFTVALLYRAVTYWFAMLPGLLVMPERRGKS